MALESADRRGTDLLLMLEAIVHKDSAPSGFDGEVSIGVVLDEEKDQEAWWSAVFERGQVETRFVEEEPDTADVIFVLGEREANAIMDVGQAPDDAQILDVEGDNDLLDRFLQRYLVDRSMVDLRVQQSGEAPSKKRRKR